MGIQNNNLDPSFSLGSMLDGDDELFGKWTGDRDVDEFNRCRLVSHLLIVENDVDNHPSGTVTGHLKCFVDASSVEQLSQLWHSKFWRKRYNNTCQHFIADMKERKIVKFLSVCM